VSYEIEEYIIQCPRCKQLNSTFSEKETVCKNCDYIIDIDFFNKQLESTELVGYEYLGTHKEYSLPGKTINIFKNIYSQIKGNINKNSKNYGIIKRRKKVDNYVDNK